MANRRANPFSISSLLDKRDDEKDEKKSMDVKEEEPCQDNSEDECSKDVKPALERIPSTTEDSKQHRIHSWFTEYQTRQTGIEASKYIQYHLYIHYNTLLICKHFRHLHIAEIRIYALQM